MLYFNGLPPSYCIMGCGDQNLTSPPFSAYQMGPKQWSFPFQPEPCPFPYQPVGGATQGPDTGTYCISASLRSPPAPCRCCPRFLGTSGIGTSALFLALVTDWLEMLSKGGWRRSLREQDKLFWMTEDWKEREEEEDRSCRGNWLPL